MGKNSPRVSDSAHSAIPSTEMNDAKQSWGSSVIQRPANDNTSPDSNNPAQMDLTNSKGPDSGNPSAILNGPAEKDPTNYHTTTEHPPGTSPAFKQFREFWCGAYEGRDQSVCCLGNQYGAFRPFTGELTCEKSMSFFPPLPLFHYPSTIT